MRSVFIHLIDTIVGDVEATLAAFARAQDNAVWLYPPQSSEPSLYVHLIDYTLEPEDLATILQALGQAPDVSVAVDISGRVPGDAEVRAIVEHLLGRFGGVAQDDYSNHCWTLPEIRGGTKIRGHRFFDYVGWHHETSGT